MEDGLDDEEGAQSSAQGAQQPEQIGVKRCGEKWLAAQQVAGGDARGPIPVDFGIHQGRQGEWVVRQGRVQQQGLLYCTGGEQEAEQQREGQGAASARGRGGGVHGLDLTGRREWIPRAAGEMGDAREPRTAHTSEVWP
ncbi:MAG: hypothetical protein CMJ87_05575 [Planctomycetes bacterium]|nr:hypothetical protein [Planctomycetota bacterium]